MARIAHLIFIIFLAWLPATSWSYSYDAHLPLTDRVNLAFESQNQYYDGTPNLCYRCIFSPSKKVQKKTLGGSFFAFEIGFVATNGGTQDVFHTVTNPAAGQGVLKGIDPRFLNPDSRFGKAFYIADDAPTTVAELAHHGAKGSHTIRYNLNYENAKVLDLTDPAVAKKWGYSGGDITPATKAIGAKATESGYNTIKFPSLRGEGTNYGVLSNFDEVLLLRWWCQRHECSFI